MMKRGVYVGRFQPFHNGHLEDIKNALKEVDELAIGIGSSQDHDTKDNPFSATERIEMISLALQEENITNRVFFTVPDYHDDEKWIAHIEDVTVPFEVAFTGHNEWTERCFKKAGYTVKRLPFTDGISGTKIRQLIREKKRWHHLVPKQVASYIEYIKGEERIQSIK